MTSYKPVDFTYLKEIRAMSRPGTPDILCTVAGLFLSQAPGILASASEALKHGDFGQASRLAHKLRSTSGNLGARPLFDCLGRFETLEANRSLEERLALFALVEEECARVRAVLEQGLKRNFEDVAG